MSQNHDTIHVICIQWGSAYSAKDINRLESMVRRHTTLPVKFHLFSDSSFDNLSSSVTQHSEPGLDTNTEHSQYNYRKEAALCDENLGGLEGQRVFFFDLDVLIMEELDSLFNYPDSDKFYIINDWNTKGNHVGQASCYSFVVGTLGHVKRNFEEHSAAIIERFGTASQEYLSDQVIEHFGKLEFWPEHWCQSFRFHCLPWAPLRHFRVPSKPDPGTKVLVFHGHPDLEDAINGTWGKPGERKSARGWKKIYKCCLPTPWVANYWK